MRPNHLILLALGFAFAADAQTVQKCVSRSGQARYQSTPCEQGMKTAEVWDAVPETIATPAVTASGERRRASRQRGTSRRRTHASYPSESTDACAQARAYRDEGERRAGLSRNYELLSALQRRVYDACR